MSEDKSKTIRFSLNSIPKIMGATICFVSFLCSGSIIVIAVLSIINGKPFLHICMELTLVDMLSIGLALIAMAVSAWVGLNVYTSISRDELDTMKLDFQKGKEDLDEAIRESRTKQECAIQEMTKEKEDLYKAILQQNFISTLNTQSSKYMILSYFSSVIQKEGYDVASIDDYLAFISAEGKVIDLTAFYEENRYTNCYKSSEYALLDFRKLESAYNKETALKMYIDMRVADILFYKNASALRINKKEFETDKEELLESIDLYFKIKQFVEKDDVDGKERLIVNAYINNTIGYTYDLLYRITDNGEYISKAISYLKKSTENMDLIWNDKRARYLRNLGLAYEHSSQWNDALDTYNKSIIEDPSDYKTLNVLGTITIKILEEELSISDRDKVFFEKSVDSLADYKEKLENAKSYLERAILLRPIFDDPHYKMIQVCTYLYLITRKADEISEVKKQVRFMEGIHRDPPGYLFALRNYLEAIGEIEEAKEVNERIKEKVNNSRNTDCEHIQEIYDEYLNKHRSNGEDEN